jgi:hypothetical protein
LEKLILPRAIFDQKIRKDVDIKQGHPLQLIQKKMY